MTCKNHNFTPEDIDAILPQTQCGLCGYGGCMPYAEALVYEQAAINLCPPGGVKTLQALGNMLQQDPTVYLADIEKAAKPNQLAIVRESECIGCTKCIQACPVDAIIGSAKQMHSIISDECTGCELCIPPCPVDCIDLLVVAQEKTAAQKNAARERFNMREKRLKKEKAEKEKMAQQKTAAQNKIYIQNAIARALEKKKHC